MEKYELCLKLFKTGQFPTTTVSIKRVDDHGLCCYVLKHDYTANCLVIILQNGTRLLNAKKFVSVHVSHILVEIIVWELIQM